MSGPGPAAVELLLNLLTRHMDLTSQPYRQRAASIPCRTHPTPQPPEQLSLPYSITSQPWWSVGVSRGQKETVIFLLLHILCCLQKGPVPKEKSSTAGSGNSFSSTTHRRMELTAAAHQIGRRRCSECGCTLGKNKLDSTLHCTPE